jgi:hypothetical protein
MAGRQTLNFEELVGRANMLIVQGYELCERAGDCLEHNDFAGFVQNMRAASAMHGKVAVLFDSLANACERFRVS